MSDNVLLAGIADVKSFTYCNTPLAYSPETGMCWRACKTGEWQLIRPGTGTGGYTRLRLGANQHQLHRIVAEVFLNAGKPLTAQQEVDHIKHVDGSHGQDRLSNLRVCSRSENMRNQQLAPRNSSGFKGVSWDKSRGKWAALIMVYGRKHYLGRFYTPEAAARAYDKAAITFFGEFACTNTSLGILKPLV